MGSEMCIRDSLKHCKNCLPAVTFTKAGPCVILNDNGTIVSIDLIPLLPCPEKDPVLMFNKVTSSLVRGTLPFWLTYLKKFVKSDTLLPEVLGSPTIPDDGYISMKVLHAQSDEDIFILRPGQTLAMKNLQEPKLKKTYCYLKALKSIMKVDLTSYSLKKVLLLEDFAQKTLTARNAVELLHAALNHPHLRPYFHGHAFEAKDWDGKIVTWEIDFDGWKSSLEDNFPKKGKRIRQAEEKRYNEIPIKRVDR